MQTTGYMQTVGQPISQFGGQDAAAPRPLGPIEALVSQIESRITGLFDVSQRSEQALNRLLNPRPAEVGKGAVETPSVPTIEGRMQGIVRMLDAVDAKFREQAERLDTAV